MSNFLVDQVLKECFFSILIAQLKIHMVLILKYSKSESLVHPSNLPSIFSSLHSQHHVMNTRLDTELPHRMRGKGV